MDETKLRKERWVCTGWAGDGKGKLFQVWHTLDGDKLGEDIHAYSKPIRPGQAGMVYDVMTDGEMVYTKGKHEPVYVGQYPDDAKVQEWRATTVAEETKARLHKRMKKDVSEDMLKTALEPLRLACKATDRTGRLAIQVLVLEYLGKWGA